MEDNANINPLVQIVITVLKQRNLYDLYDIGAGAGEDDARAIVSAVLDAQAHILDDNGEVPCRVWVCPHGFAIHYKERIPVGTGEWIHSTRTDVCDDNGAGRVMVDVVPKQAMQEFMADVQQLIFDALSSMDPPVAKVWRADRSYERVAKRLTEAGL